MNILIFFVVLVILILVHEFGHFIVAKKSGIRVDEFGIGFPPKLFGKKFGETEYTINLLPIGGFVRIWGEDPSAEHYDPEAPDANRSFVQQPKYIQALVLVAGVCMNILLAYVLFAGAYMIGMPTSATTLEEVAQSNMHNVKLYISSLSTESPANEALKASDEIRALSTENNTLTSDTALAPGAVSEFVRESNGTPITFSLMRRGEPIEVTVSAQKGIITDDPERYALGFTMILAGTEQLGLIDALVQAVPRTYSSLIDVLNGLFRLITGKEDLSQVSGPVGIVGLVGDAVALGFTWLMTFSAYISLNLAVINLFPFPALDGGRLVFVAIEAATRKPIPPTVANRANQIGFAILLLLMLLVTASDIIKLF